MAPPQTDILPSSAACLHSDHAHSTPHAPHWQTQLWQRLVVGAMIHATAGIQALSRPAALRFGDNLGKLAYRVAGRQRRRCLANLHLAYGDELTPAQRDSQTRQVFRHFGRAIVEFLRAPARSTTALSQLISCDGWEHVEAALHRGKGIVLVTGHLGNWELLGRWLATVQKVPLTVVAREPDNPALATYIRSMRENAGFTVLSKGESARGLLRALRRGEAILILADQSSSDVFAPFFGIPAGTAAGPATLAMHSRAALVPICCVETPEHTFHVTCFPPLPITDGTTTSAAIASEDRQCAVQRITARMNQVLETIVRQYPEQWLWLHNRWKSAFEEKNRTIAWTDDKELAVARERWKT